MQKHMDKPKSPKIKSLQRAKILPNNEKFLFQVLNIFPFPIVIINPDQSIKYVNPALEKATDFCFGEVIGRKPPYPWWDEEGKNKINQDLKKALQQKGPKRIEEFFRKKGGEGFWVEIIFVPVRRNGVLQYCLSIWADITKQRKIEYSLQESEKKYRTLYETSRDSIILLTPEGILGGNPAAVQMFGCVNEKELISQSLASLSPEYQPDGSLSSIKSRRLMEIALKSGTYFFEWKNRRLDGTEFFSTVLLTRMELEGEKILQATVRDITDQKLAEQALIERQKELEAKTKELEAKTKELEEINTALNVLLKKREEDKKELEERVLLNVQELIEPYLEKLKKSGINKNQKVYLSILETNLKSIISPFAHTLFSKYLHLTPTEIEIANQIKQGRTTKEIASVLNLALSTIECYRKRIRKKLGVSNKKINLRTYLNTLQQ